MVKSLASFSRGSAKVLLRTGWCAFAQQHNLGFLAFLIAGMAVSFVLFAHIFETLLQTHEVYVTGFFFGLIAASVFHVGAQSNWRWLATVGLAGVVAGGVVGLAGTGGALGGGLEAGSAASAQTASAMMIFVAGALASTAWILPGVSGAFVLVLLGLYQPMLAAVTNGDLSLMVTFAAGMGVGLIGFAKALAWLLERARAAVIGLLTGFMAGSVVKLWPWRAASVEDTFTLGVVGAMALGVLAIVLLAVQASRRRGAKR